MQNAVINVNGRIQKPEDAKVSVFDRGYLYGDSLYEVARTYDGRFFKLDEHLDRLEKSAGLCRMTLGQSLDDYRREIDQTFAAFRAQPGMGRTEAYCRIIVTRGVGKIGFGLKNILTPTQFVIIVQPIDEWTSAQYQKGFKFTVSDRLRNHPRALDPAMKSGNYLNSILAYLDGVSAGYDDALLCDGQGFVTEGTTFNVFYARRGIIATPPLDIGILDGITRRLTMQVASELGVEVREVRFPKERLYEADEVFMTSSIKEVFPVTQIDDVIIRGGKPGPITLKLADGYRRHVGLLKQGAA